MLPVLRQLEGEGKEAVCSHGFGRYSIPEGEMGMKNFRLIPTYSAARELMLLGILTATSSVLSKNLQKGISWH